MGSENVVCDALSGRHGGCLPVPKYLWTLVMPRYLVGGFERYARYDWCMVAEMRGAVTSRPEDRGRGSSDLETGRP